MSNVSDQFRVIRAKSNVDIVPIADITYGENVTLNATLNGGEGYYQLFSGEYLVKSNETLFETFNNLASGNYTVIVFNNGDSNHNKSNASATFNVKKASPQISIVPKNFTVGDAISFEVLDNMNLTLNIGIYKNNTLIANKTVSGNNVVFDSLNAGNYVVLLNSTESENYTRFNISYSFNVNKLISTVNITSDENGVIVVGLTDDGGNPIKGAALNYTTGDVKAFNVTDANGLIRISGLTGEITINVTYGGNESYNGVNASKSFNFKAPAVVTKISVSSTQKGVVIKVVDDKNNPISNLEVKYSVNGINYTDITGSDGTFSVQLTGEGEIKAFVEDSDDYVKSNASYKYNFTQTSNTNTQTPTTMDSPSPKGSHDSFPTSWHQILCFSIIPHIFDMLIHRPHDKRVDFPSYSYNRNK